MFVYHVLGLGLSLMILLSTLEVLNPRALIPCKSYVRKLRQNLLSQITTKHENKGLMESLNTIRGRDRESRTTIANRESRTIIALVYIQKFNQNSVHRMSYRTVFIQVLKRTEKSTDIYFNARTELLTLTPRTITT